MYNNPYYSSYNNPQANIDRINNQIAELEKLKQQIPQQLQPTNLTQNFQITPNNNTTIIRYANSIDEVEKNVVIGDTPFFSRDMSVVWIKDTKNNIKTYELNEILPKDSKDIQIEYLQSQIEELKGMIKNDEFSSNANAKQDATDTTEYDEPIRTTIKKVEPTSIQKVSGSKKK